MKKNRKIQRIFMGITSIFYFTDGPFHREPILRNGKGLEYRNRKISSYFDRVGGYLNTAIEKEKERVG